MSHAIGIDVGTTNVKVALGSDGGAIVASASRGLASRRDDGAAEQDAEAVWGAVLDAVAEATAAAPTAAADVAAICVCSQYSSIVPVDARGAPVAPMTLYWDHRGTARSWQVLERHPEALGTFLEHHGIPPIGSGLSLGHILSFQHDRPDVHAATAAYLEPMDYVNARLTGTIAATQCTMFMSQVCDNRTVGTTEYDAELVRLSGVDPTRLPRLLPVDGVVGEVLPDVAARIGVRPGVTVHAAMNDSHAGAFAAGVFAPGRGGLAIGTTAVLLDTVDDKRADLEAELVSMPSPIPGRYLAWAENGIAGKAVEHVLEHVVYAVDELADHFSDDFFAALDSGLAASPPGSHGVLFLPWLAGSMAPSANARMRGAFVNLSLETRRTDLVRSMVEGTALNVGWLLPAVERFTGQRIEEVAFFGGAARSTGWAQILADVLGRPVLALRDPDRAVARAMGLVALERSGLLGGDVSSLVDVGATYDPRAEHRTTYRVAQEQFVAAFDALRPINEALGSPVAGDEAQEGSTP